MFFFDKNIQTDKTNIFVSRFERMRGEKLSISHPRSSEKSSTENPS